MKTKMKNKYVLPILLIGTVGLQGCSDFLDTEPTEGFPETTVWETPGYRWSIRLSAIMVTHTGHTKVSPHGTKLSVTIW